MNRKNLIIISSCIFVLFFAIIFSNQIKEVIMSSGIVTLIPPVLAIVLAFLTKNVVISLFLGILSGSLILEIKSGKGFLIGSIFAFMDLISRCLNSLADPWNAGIILQVLCIGGVINLVAKMGGAKAVAESLSKKAKSSKGAQIISWILGILVFFDDYANSLIIGPIMRPVFDKMKISREKLAFVIDATAAPVAGIAIISTWIGLEVGLIHDAFESLNIKVDSFGIFLNTIPYRFYNILILIFIIASALMVREFGSMRKVEYLARRKKINENISNDSEMEDLRPKENIKLSIWNAIIPIGVLIICSLIAFYYSGYSTILSGEDKDLISSLNNSPFSFNSIRECFSSADASKALFQSSVFSSIVTIILAKLKNIFKVSEAIDEWINGMKTLIITGVILVLAWSLSSVIKEVGTAKFLISYLSGSLPKFLLPSIIFLLGSIISFSTGTAFGTMGILMPLAIPLSHSISADMNYIIVSTSAVLTGAIFGDHCSPISDTTILSSMGANCNHIDHVKTQMPYAIYIAIITILFGYIPAGFGLPFYIILPIAIFVVCIGLRIIGKRTDVDDLKFEEILRKEGFKI